MLASSEHKIFDLLHLKYMQPRDREGFNIVELPDSQDSGLGESQ